MGIVERTLDAPEHWPTMEELERVATDGTVIMLPDRLEETDGQLVAAFRLDAQGMRVAATEAGLTPILYAPAGAELAMYTENAADWVLPVIVAAVLAFPGQIGATLAADWIEAQMHQQPTAQTVIYREAIVQQGSLKLYEIEGAPGDVTQLLRSRGQKGAPQQPLAEELSVQPLSKTPPDQLDR
jgi:hypothetical protein